jgi:rRNA maturation endonuclease Nob1
MKISIEKLFHFNCPDCQKWWAIGDWTPTEFMFCPHCGKRFKTGMVEEEK